MGKIFVPHKPDKKEDVEADVIGRVKEWSREAESGVWELRLGEGKEQKTKVRKIDWIVTEYLLHFGYYVLGIRRAEMKWWRL